MKILLSFTGLVSMTALGLLVACVVENDTHQTGFEPWLLSVVFVPTIIIGGLCVCYRDLRIVAVIAIAAGIAGMAVLVYWDRTNTLLPYERWIERGMP